MERIQVVNVKMAGWDMPDMVYIGRPSPLGNPFRIGRDGTREEVIAKYEKWLKLGLHKGCRKINLELERIAGIVKSRGRVFLACWCSPMPCHGDIVKKYVEQRCR